ncbi:MAG: hypothetical protein ABJF01_21370 [bacterium]
MAPPARRVVRAALASVASLVTVHCRPVTRIQTTWGNDFLSGDSPRRLPVDAIGEDGKVVTQLRGSVRVVDSNVATLERGLLTPRASGASPLVISIGDARVKVAVVVHELVERFDNLTPAQRHVAIPLRLALRDTLHFLVPAGTSG